MDEHLLKRTADLLVIDLLEMSYKLERVKKITLTFDEFCKVIGRDRSIIQKLIKHKHLPENIIIGGYANRKQRTKLLFDTERTLEWLRNQKETEFAKKVMIL